MISIGRRREEKKGKGNGIISKNGTILTIEGSELGGCGGLAAIKEEDTWIWICDWLTALKVDGMEFLMLDF